MRRTLLALGAIATAAFLTPSANAANILNFTQAIAGLDPITGTVSTGQTTIATTGFVGVSVNCITCGALVTPNFVLNATSVTAATNVSGIVVQRFSGSFSVLAGAVNVLSGTFTDAAVFGTGTSLTLSVSDASPGQSLSFTSAIIPASLLGDPRGLSLSSANVTPLVGTSPAGCSGTAGCTLAAFTSSVSGTASANPVVPEPATLALLGTGLLGLGLLRYRRRR